MKHGSHTLSDEWRKKDGYDFRTIRCRRRIVGEIRRYDKQVIYLAKCHPDEVFYRLDAWAFEMETIELCRMLGVRFVGVLTTSGDRYLTRIGTFSTTGGALTLEGPGPRRITMGKQWFVPRSLFSAIKSPEGELEMMKLPKRA